MKLGCSGLLFDNDGVLVDSAHQVDVAWTAICEAYGLNINELLTQLIGVRAEDTLGRFLSGSRLAQAVADLEQLEIDGAANTPAIGGAVALLNSLRLHEWCAVTSASRRLAEARWAGAGIPMPPHRVTAEDVTMGKPHPEPFLTGAQRLGLDPVRCVAFEDSPSGGQAARAAGCLVVAVGDIEWPIEPDARVDDLSQVSVERTATGLAIHL